MSAPAAQARLWAQKWRWYERNSLPWNRARIHWELMRRGAFARWPVHGNVLEALREGRLEIGRERAARARRVDHRARARRACGSAPGTFLNLGVMVAAQELVEIGEHCMLANGCFVTDANHRFDDPERPITWQGFETQGADADRRQLLARRERRRDERREHRRALRDRRQQRRDARHRALLDRRGFAGARAALGRPGRGGNASGRYASAPSRRRSIAVASGRDGPLRGDALRADEPALHAPSRSRARCSCGRSSTRASRPAAATARAGAWSSSRTPSGAARCATCTCRTGAPTWSRPAARALLADPDGFDAERACAWSRRADEYAEQLARGAAPPGHRRASRGPRRDRRAAAAARASSAAPRSTRSCRTSCSRCAPRVWAPA